MVALVALAALLGGMVAAVAGFGIGSLLTPALATLVPAKLAVAAVAVPHLVATGYRLWLMRAHVDLKLLRSFGATSAAGGLLGAAANYLAASRALEVVLAILLLFVGMGGLLGWTRRMRFTGGWAWVAGAVSGFLGGLVGNQGGLRAGAMTGLGVSRDAFVATATATGLVVDLARTPIYLVGQWDRLRPLWPLIGLATLGVLAGTVVGMALLRRVPEERFFRVVSALLVALGVWMLLKPLAQP